MTTISHDQVVGILTATDEPASPEPLSDKDIDATAYDIENEKDTSVKPAQSLDGDYDWDSEEFRDIPDIVRETVSFEDDPTMRYFSFRVFFLSTIFCVIGSTVSQIA
jgi:hypothetical protein